MNRMGWRYSKEIEQRKRLVVQSDMLLFAFRYVLGRSSYAVGAVIRELMNNIDNISNEDIENYIKEIDKCKNYGMAMDARSWKEFKLFLKNELQERKQDVSGEKECFVDSNILFFAFRYSLSENKNAPEHVISGIKENINLITNYDIESYVREINEYAISEKHWEMFLVYLREKLEKRTLENEKD